MCHVMSRHSCLTLCKPTDRSPPGSSVHGILEARILEQGCPPPEDLPASGAEPVSLMSTAWTGGYILLLIHH